MKSIAIKIVVNGIALWVAALVISGIHLGEDADALSTRLLSILIVAVVFGVINVFIKPIVRLFSLPLILLTLGLFTIIVNAFMLQLLDWVAGPLGLDFSIDHFFWDAVFGAIIISLVSMILNTILPDGD